MFSQGQVCGICICSHFVRTVHASHPRSFSFSSTMNSNQSKIPAALEQCHLSSAPIAEASAVLRVWQRARLVKSVFEFVPRMKARHPLYVYLRLRCVCRKVLQVTHVQIEAVCSALFISLGKQNEYHDENPHLFCSCSRCRAHWDACAWGGLRLSCRSMFVLIEIF